MSRDEKIKKISQALTALGKDLDELEKAGEGVPAVIKNAVRMRGALRQLEVQFLFLEDGKA